LERSQYETVAVGAGLLAVIAAIASGRLPRWLRIVLIGGLVILACGIGLFAYRYATQPTTLTVAAGSLDGDAPRFMSAFAVRLAATNAPIRLKVVDTGTALEAVKTFSAGKADLAIVRADVGDLSAARTVVVITHAVVLIVVPPGGAISGMDDLKNKTVGVVNGEMNRHLVSAITKEYDLDRAKVQFKELALNDVPQALKSKQVQALLVTMPVSGKYLGMLRDLFPRGPKLKVGLVPIEAAGAIAAIERSYESFDLPKGTIRGSPPVPDDDLTTLRVPFYLVANRKLSDEVVGALIKSVMETRRDLLGEYPLLSHISAPSTDKDALIPIHPGAAAYLDGDQKTFFDKYGDQIFYGSMLLGTLTSLFAGAWKFMAKDSSDPQQLPLTRLYSLTEQITNATSEAELAETERRIDDILKSELEKHAAGGADPGEAAALGLATHRLEYLMSQRRAMLIGRSAPTAPV
jgi:TRAP transporter TAXI family solute receptor